MSGMFRYPYLIVALIVAAIVYIGYYHVYLPNKVREYKIEKQVKEKTAKIINKRRLEDAKEVEKEIESVDTADDIDPYIINTDGMLF